MRNDILTGLGNYLSISADLARAKAMRRTMKEYICKEVPTDNGGYLEIENELIRCKDCKYAKPIDSEWLECQHDKRVMKEYGFCSWAEPKVKE